MKTYTAFQADNGEVLVIPSITPNTTQRRVGVRIENLTLWFRYEEATNLAKQLLKEAKP